MFLIALSVKPFPLYEKDIIHAKFIFTSHFIHVPYFYHRLDVIHMVITFSYLSYFCIPFQVSVK